ncbi:MAG: peptidase M16, partial [Anaerolineales bacterium]|nr:peptidase M16 [Anaerolineales bacterium]
SDLDKQNKQIPLEHLQFLGSEILYHDLFTNGIVYLDTGFDLHTLPIDLLPYVPLFGRALIEVGTEKEDFVKLSQRIGRTTGGLRPTTFTTTKHETDIATSWLFLRGKATMDHTGDLLDILHDILLTAKFDNRERVLQMVLENKASYEASLAPAGHQFVSSRLGAIFSEAGWVNEQMGGVDHLFFLRQLIHDIENDWESVLGKLEAIRTILINRNNMLLNVTLDSENFSNFNPQLKEFLELLPASEPQSLLWKPELLQGFEGLTIPTQVNYVGKAANIYNLGYTFHGSILVITKHLGTTWLWDRVRVQGGAYGAFCSFNRRSGIFSYGSYRDPNLQHTLTNYDDTGRYLRQLELNDEGITKSIIGTIGDLDAYQLPDAKGYSSMIRYLVGDTEEYRQKLRDEVLDTSLEHFTAFADILDAVKDDGMVVVLGSQETITTANHSKPGWLSIKKVL